jgi:hypothetical protein
MSHKLIKVLAVLVVLVVVRSAGADQVRCQRTLSSESAKDVQAVVKALQRCHDRQVAGTLPAGTDCATEAGTAARVAKAEARLRGRVVGACGGADHVCGTGDDDPLAAIGWSAGACPDLAGRVAPTRSTTAATSATASPAPGAPRRKRAWTSATATSPPASSARGRA